MANLMKLSMARRFAIIISLIPFIFPLTTHAWNALGHMVVANIAYQHLNKEVRDTVDDLASHLHEQYPDMESFLQLAYWPDAIRSQKIETSTHWHYINLAFSNDGTSLKDVIDTDNAVWAINTIEPVVKNVRANPYERVRFLAYLVHIVADLHQPLHTVTYFSAAHPGGDKGGNLYMIRYKNRNVNTINLHRLWDGGVGNFDSDFTAENADRLANMITALYPESYFGNQINDLNPENWAWQGLNNAKKYVYSTPEYQPPASDYIETGKRIAEQEVALAGYRLAILLNHLLAPPPHH
jgi:hypothetical protein